MRIPVTSPEQRREGKLALEIHLGALGHLYSGVRGIPGHGGRNRLLRLSATGRQILSQAQTGVIQVTPL